MNASDTGNGAPCCESKLKLVPHVGQLWCRSQPVAAVHSPQPSKGLASSPTLTPDTLALTRGARVGQSGNVLWLFYLCSGECCSHFSLCSEALMRGIPIT